MQSIENKPNSDQLQKTNSETGRIHWQELQPQFAKGILVIVDQSLDLIEIATAFIGDDSKQVGALMKRNKVRKAETEDAQRWQLENTEFWAVVAAPWVLIQEYSKG